MVSHDWCVPFLQWALPRLGMRWKGFRKVRRQVCRRIRDRIEELGLAGPEAYREWLEDHDAEWEHLATLCRVTISRFFRDRGVYRQLGEEVLPRLAAATDEVQVWSAGCASGEEPYGLNLLWVLQVQPRVPDTQLRILATDVDPVVLDRARAACYPAGALKELDPEWIDRAFVREGAAGDPRYRLRPEYRAGVEFRLEDIRQEMPVGAFHLISCRNLAFTYFDRDEQRRILAGLLERLVPGGALVLGAHETLPEGSWPLERWSPGEPVYLQTSPQGTTPRPPTPPQDP